MLDDKISLNLEIEHKLLGLIAATSKNHYNTIIFNPIGLSINTNFNPSKIYYHDGLDNNGKITEIDENMIWKDIGIPYIVLYKKIDR